MTRDAWRGVVADIGRAATVRGRNGLRCYAIEGTRVHERVMRAGGTIERAVLKREFLESETGRPHELIRRLREQGCSLHVAPDAVVDELMDGRSTGAVVGLARLPQAAPALDALASVRQSRILVAVNVEDPGNVGALTRTALACGASALVAVGRSEPYHPRAVRTSMGSIARLPVARAEAAAPVVETLRAAGACLLGAVARGGTAPESVGLGHAAVALFVGNEAFGLPGDLVGSMDARVSVPMATPIDSLSVNAAAAVILYELDRRQRAGPVNPAAAGRGC